MFDSEGELTGVIGKPGRCLAKEKALEFAERYSIFNDGSVRHYQYRHVQWIVSKNFDRSGGFSPCLVPAKILPDGASKLVIETRLNGVRMQCASIADMIFFMWQPWS